jgi:hypothetical protein
LPERRLFLERCNRVRADLEPDETVVSLRPGGTDGPVALEAAQRDRFGRCRTVPAGTARQQ